MDEKKRFEEVEITEVVIRDPKALAEILNTLVKTIFKPGGYVWQIRENGNVMKNVVNVLVEVLLNKKVIKPSDLKVTEWIPLGEVTPMMEKFRIEGMTPETIKKSGS